jgi:molecular chaperone HscB
MSFDLQQNYFDLFDMPVSFGIDHAELAVQFRDLQSVFHPDRFIAASDAERLESTKATALINAARDTLVDTRLRARYMLSLKGVDFNDEIDTSTDPTYLMGQMELRESIEDAEHADDPFAELDSLHKIVQQRKREVEDDFSLAYEQHNFDVAKQAALKMRFCERIISEIKRIEERIDDDDF